MLRTSAKVFSLIAAGFFLTLMGMMLADAWPMLFSGELLRPGYWDFRGNSFQALAMFAGTFAVTFIAIGIAFPVGTAAAIYLSEYLKKKRRAAAKVTIELLAGIPSVVYGLIGVVFLLPMVAPVTLYFGGFTGDSLLAAGLLLAIMILPTMTTFADDALRCVPANLREQASGLGMSHTQVILYTVLPAAFPGIVRAGIIAIGRAIGETIAIFLVIGRSDLPFAFADATLRSVFDPGQTLTTKLGGSELSIAYGDATHWAALMTLGVFLWLTVGLLSFFSERLLREAP